MKNNYKIYYSYFRIHPKGGQYKVNYLRNYYNLTEEQFNNKIASLKEKSYMKNLKIIIL